MTSVIVAPPDWADDSVTLPSSESGRRRGAGVVERLGVYARQRAVLLGTLAVVAAIAIRMIAINSAFLDEATYLSAGHVIWHNWLHGGPDLKYSTYFSGAPVIYPVIAAVADAIGGLYAARVFSLICILVTIGLVDGTTRRLFGARAAGWATVIFATIEGTQFLAAFATYDAMALMCLALAVWTSLRYLDLPRDLPHAGLYLGVPLLAFANATKYATALYDPIVVGVVVLAYARRYGWRASARIAVVYSAILGALIAALLAVGGSRYATGIDYTTLKRPPGISTASAVIDSSLRWVGALAAVCVIGMVVATYRLWRRRWRSMHERATLALLGVLSLAVFLAPIEQVHVHTTISLQKHVAFGAWFAAIAAGAMISRFTAGGWRAAKWRWVPVVAFIIPLGVIGQAQASRLHNAWPNTTILTRDMAPYVQANDRPVLMDDSEVAEYYLGANSDPRRWNNTYYLRYPVPGTSQVLYGPAAYKAAIAHDHFGLVALNFGVRNNIDRIVQNAIHLNHHYRYLGEVRMDGAYGYQTYVIWIDWHQESTKAMP